MTKSIGIMLTGGAGILSVAWLEYMGESVGIMFPWLITMTVVVFADLFSGLRKSWKLGVKLRWSAAGRETFGKLVQYWSFVLCATAIDVSIDGHAGVAKWLCIAVVALELGSIFSNLLRPYGIILTPLSFIRFILRCSPLALSEEDAEKLVHEAQKNETDKWARPFEKVPTSNVSPNTTEHDKQEEDDNIEPIDNEAL